LATKTDIKYTDFANEYIKNGGNARQAYQKVYPNVKDTTADVNGSKLLRNAKVQDIITKLQKEIADKELVTKEEVIEALKRIAMTAEAGDQLAVARSCWQDLGKTNGSFVERQEIKADVDVKSPLADAIKEMREDRTK